ncbi:endoplasmic oxidoreductin [Lichtheimia hyalospora FSU 10163]|nr:endoplasmic oxidoreductin [Lichtheimia hyalospora FSU 10163]
MTLHKLHLFSSIPLFTFLLLLFNIAHAGFQPSLQENKPIDFVENVLEPSENYCNPSGQIEDTCCDFRSVEELQRDAFDKIQSLVHSKFFRYYKINLWRECPFWNEDGFCMNRDCAVETTDESSLPEEWRQPALSAVQISPKGSGFQPFQECQYKDQDFCLLNDEFDSECVYVDLTENPERFTGYSGESSARVWNAIYRENCFNVVEKMTEGCHTCNNQLDQMTSTTTSPNFASVPSNTNQLRHFLSDMAENPDEGDEEVCLEKRVYYRLISGLHSSISIHICDEYFDQNTGQWKQNLDCFVNRIGSHPERLQNIYFTYAVIVRAVSKLGGYMNAYNFCTGNDQEDKETKDAVLDLINTFSSCPTTFDESTMFQGPDAKALKVEFRDHFRNVTSIMDCVGCEKCRLWGKIQTTGLATALKILFSYEEDSLDPLRNPGLLQRTEIVALFNTLNRFTESLHAIERFRELYQERSHPTSQVNGASFIHKLLAQGAANLQSTLAQWNIPLPSVMHRLLDTLIASY